MLTKNLENTEQRPHHALYTSLSHLCRQDGRQVTNKRFSIYSIDGISSHKIGFMGSPHYKIRGFSTIKK